jgi:hypothetical protein
VQLFGPLPTSHARPATKSRVSRGTTKAAPSKPGGPSVLASAPPSAGVDGELPQPATEAATTMMSDERRALFKAAAIYAAGPGVPARTGAGERHTRL